MLFLFNFYVHTFTVSLVLTSNPYSYMISLWRKYVWRYGCFIKKKVFSPSKSIIWRCHRSSSSPSNNFQSCYVIVLQRGHMYQILSLSILFFLNFWFSDSLDGADLLSLHKIEFYCTNLVFKKLRVYWISFGDSLQIEF